MAIASTTYIIGAIREKEKGLLEEDEYTRLIQAPSPQEATHVLIDTPYGIHIEEQKGSAFAALTAHLKHELEWLAGTLDKIEVLQFITTRYDALNIATAFIEKRDGEPKMTGGSPLGLISNELLTTTIWDHEKLADLPELWRTIIEKELELADSKDWRKTDLLRRMKRHMIVNMKSLAFTGLMDEIASLSNDHLLLDEVLRTGPHDAQGSSTKIDIRRDELTDDIQRQVRDQQSGTAYERVWDRKLLRILKKYRWKADGYDVVLAYWYAKELETRTIRLLLSAKLGGIPTPEIESLKRPLYRAIP